MRHKKILFLIFVVCLIETVAAFLPTVFKEWYFYYAAYRVLYFVILAYAWNMLGGYCGFMNFGVGAFAGVSAYASAYLLKIGVSDFLTTLLFGVIVSTLLGFVLAFCTVRVTGSYFSIASLALTFILQAIILSQPELGGGGGLYIPEPAPPAPYTDFREFLFVLAVGTALVALLTSWKMETAWIGKGLLSIKDDEIAAGTLGVDVVKLKLLVVLISSAFMGFIGATLPYYVLYLEPYSTMSIEVTVTTVASVYLGGIGNFLGPLIGGGILGTIMQTVTVTISSELNMLVVGILLVVLITSAPTGIMGIVKRMQGVRQSND